MAKDYSKQKGKLKIFVDIARTYREFLCDANNYRKYSMLVSNNANNYEYQIMLRMHGLEKGFCMKDLRPFGQKKVVALFELMKKVKSENKISTGYKMAEGIIVEWLTLFEEKGWTNDKTYKQIKSSLDDILVEETYEAGTIVFSKKDVNDKVNSSFNEFCHSRHSIRQFDERNIADEDLTECIGLAQKAPTACNRQMNRVYFVKSEEGRKLLLNLGLGFSGFSLDTVNLFVVTYDLAAFNFYGERSQGYFNAGLFVMNLIYAFHHKGIGSCCLQWGKPNKLEKEVKRKLGIPQNEKIAVVLGAGYYLDENVVPKSYRRDAKEVLEVI